jgi:hypothetical protein
MTFTIFETFCINDKLTQITNFQTIRTFNHLQQSDETEYMDIELFIINTKPSVNCIKRSQLVATTI